VLEGVELDLWRFDDMSSAQSLLAAYRAERDGLYDASDIQKAVKRAGSLTALTIVDPDKDQKDRDGS
jgi:curli production assembly/transport component CsgG